MTTTNNYLIAYSNTTRPGIDLTPGEIDATSTSLTLYGYGAKDYGKGLMSNTLKLLENFCNATSPNNPIEGQLWFNSSSASLNVCYRATGGSLSWKPVAPVAGWDSSGGSTTSSAVSSTDSTALAAMLNSYVPVNGNITSGAMTGSLKLFNDPTWYTTNSQGSTVINEAITTDLSSYAATRKYVDLKVNSVVIAQNTAANWSVTPAQLIAMIEGDVSPYIKRVATRTTDNLMVSPLILRDQSNPLTVTQNEAVSKRYVDSATAAIISGMSTGSGTVPQYIKDLLKMYVPVAGINATGFTGITTHLPILDEPSWYNNTDSSLNKNITIPNNYAATVKYVNTKVADALKATGGGISWPVSSRVVIDKIQEDKGGPYIHKTSTDVGYRTMEKPLFVRSDQTVDTVDDNEAVSAGVVRTLIVNSKTTSINSDMLLTALNALATEGKQPWPKQVTQEGTIDTSALNLATAAANTAAQNAKSALDALKLADSNDKIALDKLIEKAQTATNAANSAAEKVTQAANDAAGKITVVTPGNDTVSSGLSDLIKQANDATDLLQAAIDIEDPTTLNRLIADAKAAAKLVTDAIAAAGNTTIKTNTTSTVDVSKWNNTTVSPVVADKYTESGKEYMKDRERISYSKLPDGTLIISGYYRKFGLCHIGDAVDWVTSIDKIRFDDAYRFVDNFYSVTITEVSHNTFCANQIVGSSDARHRGGFWDNGEWAHDGWYDWPGAALLNCDIGRTYTAAQTAAYPQGPKYPWAETKNESYPTNTIHPLTDDASDYVKVDRSDIQGKSYNTLYNQFNNSYKEFAVPPCTWMSYDQDTWGFKISGCVNKSVTWLYARNTLSCNFTAIGRWK